MKSIFKRLYFFNLELFPKYSNSQKRVQRLLMINYFLVYSIPVFIINDLVLAILKIQPYTFEKYPIIIFWVICLFALLLVKKKNYLPAKLILIFGPLVYISTYSITGYIIGEHFLWQPIVVLGLSIIPFLVLDFNSERGWLLLAFLTFLIYIIFHNDIMLYGANNSFNPVFKRLNTTPFVYNAVRILIFLFLTTIIYYSIRLNDYQQVINENTNKSLLKTSKYLEYANAELQAHRNAINNSASLIITDENQNIVSANDNFLSISGYSLNEVLEKNLTSLATSYHDEKFLKSISDTLSTGKVWRGELKNKRKDGNYFWMESAVSPIYDSNKIQKGYLAVMFNITRLKDDEARLEKLNYEKDRIFYAVAHDLKNPLLNFKALLNLIQSGAVRKDEEEEVFRLMIRDCDHSTNLITELLEIGRLEDEGFVLKKAASDLNSFLEKSLLQFREIATKKNIRFLTDLDNDLKSIDLNEKEFVHVSYNLISNALKFTRHGGEIKIKTRVIDEKNVSIEISDNGVGINQELLPGVFDKFSKAGRKGLDGEKSTGLGMWIVKHIIVLHGGKISVASQEKVGTTFSILLPR